MKPTRNALRKWAQFWPNESLANQFAASRRAGRKTRAQIARQCPAHIESIHFWRGVYRTVAPCGAVFVVGPNQLVIDVFPLLRAAANHAAVVAAAQE